MARAVLDALDWTRRHVSPAPADVVALSLGCEFATLAALAEPGCMRSLALISPTGMERRRIGEDFEDGRTRESALMSSLVHLPGVDRLLYAALTARPAMRWFLARSWGTWRVEEALMDYGLANARVRGAHHAPLDFLSGALFTRGIVDRYRRLELPVLLTHGRHGAFTDFGAAGHIAAHSPGQWERRVFDTGAMPHMECPADFDATYQSWLATRVVSGRPDVLMRFPTGSHATHSRTRRGDGLDAPEEMRSGPRVHAGVPMPGAG
jgi:pimeloyl-ACP methyl ester carboxylesterase